MGNSNKARDLGLLGLRVTVGGTLAYHGAQKLFGAFGGHGIEGTAQFFESAGFAPGKPNAVAAGLGELSGAALALGVGTPLAAAGGVGAMIGASSLHAANGFSATDGGFEYNLVLGAAAAALALTGPGKYSVDHLLGYRFNRPTLAALALSGAVAGGLATVSRRRSALAQAQRDAVDTEIDRESAEGDFLLGDYDPETGKASASEAK